MRPKMQVEAPTVMVSPKTKAAEEPAKPDSRYTDRKVQWPRTASTSALHSCHVLTVLAFV